MEDPSEQPTRLLAGLNLQDLITGDGAVFEVNFDDVNLNQFQEETAYNANDVLRHCRSECLGFEDEDTYEAGEPFAALAKQMSDLVKDGKVKKRILREGHGPLLPKLGTVTIDYNAYIEYKDEPFDSTYLRKRPFTFRVGNGYVITGLDIAVASMKVGEKSQVLIDSSYAYGKFGCLDRIPPNATILYEVEVKDVVNSGAALSYEKLDEVQQKDFKEILKFATALCERGNDLFKKGLIKAAVKDYNQAATKLENHVLQDYDEQVQQQELLLRLRINLVVSYTRLNLPRPGCFNSNRIFEMARGTSLKVPAKVYYNNARCLLMLSDYAMAANRLKCAQKLEPQNPEISQLFIHLDKLKKEDANRQLLLAKTVFKNNEQTDEKMTMTQNFKEAVIRCFEELKSDENSVQYTINSTDLTPVEMIFVEETAAKYGYKFTLSKDEENLIYVDKDNGTES